MLQEQLAKSTNEHNQFIKEFLTTSSSFVKDNESIDGIAGDISIFELIYLLDRQCQTLKQNIEGSKLYMDGKLSNERIDQINIPTQSKKHYQDDGTNHTESHKSLALCWKPTLSITILGYNDENSSINSNIQVPISQSLLQSDGHDFLTLSNHQNTSTCEQQFRASRAPSHSPRNPVLVKRTAAIEQMIQSSLSVSSSVNSSPLASPRNSFNIHKPIHCHHRTKSTSSRNGSIDSESYPLNRNTTTTSTLIIPSQQPFPLQPSPSLSFSSSSSLTDSSSSSSWWERLLQGSPRPSQAELQQTRIKSFHRVREFVCREFRYEGN